MLSSTLVNMNVIILVFACMKSMNMRLIPATKDNIYTPGVVPKSIDSVPLVNASISIHLNETVERNLDNGLEYGLKNGSKYTQTTLQSNITDVGLENVNKFESTRTTQPNTDEVELAIVNTGPYVVSYMLSGVTMFFILFCLGVIRFCLKRRDRIRSAYESYNTGQNVPVIGWRSGKTNTQSTMEEIADYDTVENLVDLCSESTQIPPPPPPPPVNNVSISNPNTLQIATGFKVRSVNNFSKNNQVALESLERQLSDIYGHSTS